MLTRFCKTCNLDRPETDFHINKDGKSYRCRPCNNEVRRKQRQSKGMKPRKVIIRKETEKQCWVCDEIKPFNCFTKHRKGFKGVSGTCKECRSKDRLMGKMLKGFIPKEDVVITETTKQCTICREHKTFDKFRNNKKGILGKTAACKDCSIKKALKVKLKYPEKQKQYDIKYKEKDPERYKAKSNKAAAKRRALKLNNTIEVVTTEFVRNLYATEICCYCKQYIERENRTMEHIIPLTRGGSHSPSNLAMACFKCNHSKVNKLPEEWDYYNKLKEEVVKSLIE
jgi:5-methylcytosine-specific restriction endonuclease McrA